MNNLSSPHAHLALKLLVNKRRTHLKIGPGRLVTLQPSDEYCVNQMSLDQNSAEDHCRTNTDKKVKKDAGETIERSDEQKYSTKLAEKSSSKDKWEIVNPWKWKLRK